MLDWFEAGIDSYALLCAWILLAANAVTDDAGIKGTLSWEHVSPLSSLSSIMQRLFGLMKAVLWNDGDTETLSLIDRGSTARNMLLSGGMLALAWTFTLQNATGLRLVAIAYMLCALTARLIVVVPAQAESTTQLCITSMATIACSHLGFWTLELSSSIAMGVVFSSMLALLIIPQWRRLEQDSFIYLLGQTSYASTLWLAWFMHSSPTTLLPLSAPDRGSIRTGSLFLFEFSLLCFFLTQPDTIGAPLWARRAMTSIWLVTVTAFCLLLHPLYAALGVPYMCSEMLQLH